MKLSSWNWFLELEVRNQDIWVIPSWPRDTTSPQDSQLDLDAESDSIVLVKQ